ncbi:MAG: hypothetical protein ACTTKL_09390, partial [Treponema sp.]
MAGFETAIAHENEIMKAHDVAFGYDAAISNIEAALKTILGDRSGDYVIGGVVKPFGTGILQIAVDPAFIFCQSAGTCAAETEITSPVTLEAADVTFDRIDVIQARALETEFDQQSRMFNDPHSGTKRMRTVPTKKRLKFDVQVKRGENGSETAPKTDEGFVKLAEIRIPAGSQTVTKEMIRNVDSRKSGGVNSGWTEDKTKTFNPGSLSEVFSTFLAAHNEDGSHKPKAIKKEHVDFGTSGEQVKGSDIPTGKSVNVHGKDFSQIADLTSVIEALAHSSNNLYSYSNDILSRYNYVSIAPVAASSAPVDIKGGGEKLIDGVTCKEGNVVLLKDQTDARENGLYAVNKGAWTRAQGFTEGSAYTHKLIYIGDGKENVRKTFYLEADSINLGIDELHFKETTLASNHFVDLWVKDLKWLLSHFTEALGGQIGTERTKLDKLIAECFTFRTGIEPKDLDTTTKSGMYPVHYQYHAGALFVFAVQGSVGIVQFLKTDYNGYTRWQYR